jgi:hypothetical protein
VGGEVVLVMFRRGWATGKRTMAGTTLVFGIEENSLWGGKWHFYALQTIN